jgi:beta-glucosidase
MKNYTDSSLNVEERVHDLLAKMTIEEKIAQLKSNDGRVKVFYRDGDTIEIAEEAKNMIRHHGLGFLICVTRFDSWAGVDADKALTPDLCALIMNKLQKFNLENSRLGIPLLHGNPASHGHMSVGSTMFPINLLTGSTWNPELFTKICRVIASESRAQGSYMSDPVIIDVIMDPRWGRAEENFGEDPYLVGEMAVAGIKGLQNDNEFGENSVVALLKHFVAHGASIGGQNRAPSTLQGRELIEKYMWPWKKAVDAGALAIMPSYNEVDGVQNHMNKSLLTGLIKNTWGFKGYIIADENGIDQLHDIDKVAESHEIAEIKSFNAGVDVDIAAGSEPYEYLLKAYKSGHISEARINEAVSRVLYAKFKVGLFENSFTDTTKAATVGCEEHRLLAREAVRQGVIMLENKNSTLPLNKNGQKIAVIGPNADNIFSQIGYYSPIQRYSDISTVYKGIKEKLKGRATTEVIYAKGCSIKEYSQTLLEDAIKAAEQSDVIIVAVGGSSWKEFRPGKEMETDCGEGCDRANLDLFEPQMTLLKALKKTGKKMIAVLINGRPMTINWLAENCDAVLEAWYPGCEGGNAIADIIFGDCCPSGKLTVSIPRHVGQLPVYYNRKHEMTKDYIDITGKPLYPFGYGLSYTKFEYGPLVLNKNTIRIGEELEAYIDVKNSGEYDADEIVQLYVSDDFASVTRPCLELKSFQRVHIRKNETCRVIFRIGEEAFKLVDENMQELVEPGSFTIMVGSRSDELKTTRLVVR